MCFVDVLLKLVQGVGLAAVGALCDMFNAEVVMQSELRLVHGFGAIRCVFRVHKNLPVVANLLWVLGAERDEGVILV